MPGATADRTINIGPQTRVKGRGVYGHQDQWQWHCAKVNVQQGMVPPGGTSGIPHQARPGHVALRAIGGVGLVGADQGVYDNVCAIAGANDNDDAQCGNCRG